MKLRYSVALVALLTYSSVFAARPAPVYLSPNPGTMTASPASSIVIKPGPVIDRSSIDPASQIVAIGSISGLHPGTTVLSDDGRTLVFRPSTPFLPGEQVSAGLAYGLRSTAGVAIDDLSWGFSISDYRKYALTQPSDSQQGDEPISVLTPASGAGGRITTDSIPSDFPVVDITQGSNIGPGRVFFVNFEASYFVPTVSSYCVIMNNDGTPYWYKKLKSQGLDFKVQPTGMMTYFEEGTRKYYGMDSTYTVVDSFYCGDGFVTDLHDCWLLPNGHALLIACDTEVRDLSGVIKGGNPQAHIIGCVIQEIDKQKNVVFEWNSFDHFNPEDAVHEDFTLQYIDCVHANSIMMDTDGNLILSSRHLDEITKIDRETGGIIWRLGGQHNEFTFLNDTLGFSHQHAARRTSTGTLTLFDNGNYHKPANSRALEYRLDEQAKTAELVWQYHHTPEIQTTAMGNVERLENGNTIVSWGLARSAPAMTEVHQDGSLAYEFNINTPNSCYRVFRYTWDPKPSAVTTTTATTFELAQNYPNPFNPTTTIRYSLAKPSSVTLVVMDLLGRTVATIENGRVRAAGQYQLSFDGSGLPSGAYLYQLRTASGVTTRTMMLEK